MILKFRNYGTLSMAPYGEFLGLLGDCQGEGESPPPSGTRCPHVPDGSVAEPLAQRTNVRK